MKGRQAASLVLSLLVVLSLLLSGLPGNAVSLAQGGGIVVDGTRAADPIATGAALDAVLVTV
ncbi:MAG TPA: hypothetical protein VLC95_14320, partial [Anaerolineae bacterium]|nr:hypothetical protein [Anaerolineae bacterium]